MIKINKIKIKNFFLIIFILFLTGCSMDGNQDSLGNGNISNMGVSEDQSVVQTKEEPHTLSENEEREEGTYYTMEEIKALGIPEDMLAYWLVLNSKIPFVSYDEGDQEFYWDEYFWEHGAPNNGLRFNHKFIIVDMNNDGGNEVILYYGPIGMVELFHYEDHAVYGYQFPLKGMDSVRINGTYIGTDGASHWYYYRLTELSKDGYTEEEIAEVMNYYGGNNYYEIGGISVSQEEYEKFQQTIEEDELAEDISFEENLLDARLLGDLSEEELYMVKHVVAEPMTDMTEYPMEPEIMQAYYEVLMSEREFISVTDDNGVYYLSDYHQQNGEYNEDYQILYFSIVDMDRNGVYEVVLTCETWVTQILYYKDGNIYSYQFNYNDEIGAITNSGVFSVGNLYYYWQNDDDDKYGIINSFDEDGCDIEEVDYNGNINDDRIRYYYFSDDMIEQYFR